MRLSLVASSGYEAWLEPATVGRPNGCLLAKGGKMRLILAATCAALLAACTQAGETLNDAAAGNDSQPANQDVPLEESANEAADPVSNEAAGGNVSACLMQDGEQLKITPLKAIGTEPFWAAKIEGRCVTYSTPEDQAGTRVWTKFTPAPDGGVWVGTLQGKPFKLITRLKPGCSDGMSDRVYPQEVTLTVGGEERRGCAAPE
jgi:uncharacterized membrane protein